MDRIGTAILEPNPDTGKPILVFDDVPRTVDDALRDGLEIIEATAEEREALRNAGYQMSSDAREEELRALAEWRLRAAGDRRSMKDKSIMERKVCAATLRALGIGFGVVELVSIDTEDAPSDVDVEFRDARFQVTELLPAGRRRDAELRDHEALLNASETLADVMDATSFESTTTDGMPFFARTASHAEVVELVTMALAKKAQRYQKPGCARLDAIVYVNQRLVVDRASPSPSDAALSTLRLQGWRSVTVFVWPWAWVLDATDAAPSWLRERVGEPLDEWVKGDIGRGDQIFELHEVDPMSGER